ncbi:hypothetical protein J6590_077526 [Homalodisca vitripennis]|nr:hypothetical protein J6590_077526 [Homalodisca vitripennis]
MGILVFKANLFQMSASREISEEILDTSDVPSPNTVDLSQHYIADSKIYWHLEVYWFCKLISDRLSGLQKLWVHGGFAL